MLPMEVLKTALSYRYTVRYIRKDERQILHSNYVLNTAFKALICHKRKLKKELVIHFVMMKTPGIYRLFRIVQDPTMLKWERNNR